MDVVTKLNVAIVTLEIIGSAIACTILVNLIAYAITNLILGFLEE